MDRQKNSLLRHLLCLALLLCMAALVIATGTTYARYRTDAEAEILFEVKTPSQIIIGTVLTYAEGNEEFDPSGIPEEWKTEGNTATLEIAVSNGSSGNGIKDQEIRFRLIGGLGLSVGEGTAEVTLKITEDGSEKIFYAEAEKILENTALHFEHGDGWVFTFFDENGKEFSRILEGGKSSYIKMSIIVDTTEIDKENLNLMIEPQFIAETID
ncbi:MAG: hypothetical protein J6J15_00445 [Oscillospiraceae bacterium]|nr:hypothetical protein [Oscillospiraceae bacterium]